MSFLGKRVNKLLLKIKQGDENSFQELADLTKGHLYKVAWLYVRNKADAEDILSEVYLKILGSLDTFNPEKDGYNWLYRMVQREAYDRNEKGKREVSLDAIFLQAIQADIEQQAVEKTDLYRELAKYSVLDQKMVYMKYLGGWTLEEIAAQVGLKKSAVHKRINKVIAELEKNKEKWWKN